MLPVQTSSTVNAASGPGWVTGTLCGSVRPGPAEHRPHGLPEDHEVEGQRPVLDVPDVDPHRVVPREVRAATDLPQTDRAGLGQEAAVHVEAVPLDLGG